MWHFIHTFNIIKATADLKQFIIIKKKYNEKQLDFKAKLKTRNLHFYHHNYYKRYE